MFCIDQNLHPEVIKIDVEAAELSVLRRAKQTIKTFFLTVFLSLYPRELLELNSSIGELVLFIYQLDYKVCYRTSHQVVDGDLQFVEYLN